jgi:GNAT superfamily N-acetyltransferase
MTNKGFEDLIPRENTAANGLGRAWPEAINPKRPTQGLKGLQLVPIRSLGARHRPAILKHLLALDADDRYLRFGYAVNDAHIASYVEHLDFSRDEIYGVYNRKLALIAVAHLAFSTNPEQKHLVEFGVSVLKASRGKGYGAQLFDRALLHARNAGATEMMIHALSENTTMLKIATRAGALVVRNGAESEAHLKVPHATLGSHMDELVGDQLAELNYTVKRQAKNIHDLLDQLTLTG